MKLIILMFILSTTLFATKKIDNLIIFKVISEEEVIKSNIEMIKTSIETNLTSLGYGIINEKIQDEALKEQKKQQNSDCYDDQCLVDTGRMLTAKKLLIIRISKQAKNFFIKLRKIDIETGIIENSTALSTKLDFQDYEKLDKIINNLTKKVFKSNTVIESINLNKRTRKFVNIITKPKNAEIYLNKYPNSNYKWGKSPRKIELIKNEIKKIYLLKYGYLVKEYELNYDSPENIVIELDKAPLFKLKLNTELDYTISYIPLIDKPIRVYNIYTKRQSNSTFSKIKYFPGTTKEIRLPQGRYNLVLRKKGYRTIYKTIRLNKDKILNIEDNKETIFIGTVETASEYKFFLNIDNIKSQEFFSGLIISLLTVVTKDLKFDFMRFGFLSDFKSDEKALKNLRFSLLNMELNISKHIYISFLLGFMLGDGDIYINTNKNNYSLMSPIGFKIGYRFDIVKNKFLFKAYQKADWLILIDANQGNEHGLALTTGLSLEYLF